MSGGIAGCPYDDAYDHAHPERMRTHFGDSTFVRPTKAEVKEALLVVKKKCSHRSVEKAKAKAKAKEEAAEAEGA